MDKVSEIVIRSLIHHFIISAILERRVIYIEINNVLKRLPTADRDFTGINIGYIAFVDEGRRRTVAGFFKYHFLIFGQNIAAHIKSRANGNFNPVHTEIKVFVHLHLQSARRTYVVKHGQLIFGVRVLREFTPRPARNVRFGVDFGKRFAVHLDIIGNVSRIIHIVPGSRKSRETDFEEISVFALAVRTVGVIVDEDRNTGSRNVC